MTGANVGRLHNCRQRDSANGCGLPSAGIRCPLCESVFLRAESDRAPDPALRLDPDDLAALGEDLDMSLFNCSDVRDARSGLSHRETLSRK
jgi:hypothetical protein